MEIQEKWAKLYEKLSEIFTTEIVKKIDKCPKLG